ncbi:hypothetical protein LOAG_09690 [Loa loa]|uniref:Uncharacterized protein n=1 Tax=Loa loa TaxID=7209 RepID=A0A1S0TR75_LOALO|nr:hypothetical protein LOAG_09690 [Loa loa]EFO18805.1 hypothetical protein LOAG_09690 [Loa loa]
MSIHYFSMLIHYFVYLSIHQCSMVLSCTFAYHGNNKSIVKMLQ